MTPPDERWWVLRAQAGDTDALTLLLLLMTFAGGLSLFALAAVALGTYVNRHTLRVLCAVELLRGELNARG